LPSGADPIRRLLRKICLRNRLLLVFWFRRSVDDHPYVPTPGILLVASGRLMSDDVSAEQNPLVFATATPGNHPLADNPEVRADLSGCRASRLDPIVDSIPANLAYF